MRPHPQGEMVPIDRPKDFFNVWSQVSEETKMRIDHDCYNFLSEGDFSEDDDYMDKDTITVRKKWTSTHIGDE